MMCLRFAALAALFVAWPLSRLRSDSIGLALEKTPAFSWIIDTHGGYTDFDGYGVGLDYGYFFAFRYRPATNPKPPRPGPYMSVLSADLSHWFGYHGLGAGTYSCGSVFSSSWTARTGIMFPFWPVSLLAGLLLICELRRKWRNRSRDDDSLCPTCSYDLRAHKAGERCPECGTTITGRSA